jgi:hypothetical protein
MNINDQVSNIIDNLGLQLSSNASRWACAKVINNDAVLAYWDQSYNCEELVQAVIDEVALLTLLKQSSDKVKVVTTYYFNLVLSNGQFAVKGFITDNLIEAKHMMYNAASQLQARYIVDDNGKPFYTVKTEVLSR